MSGLDDVQDTEAHLTRIVQQMEQRGVRYIRITWVDLSNFIRYRVVPISHFKHIVQLPLESTLEDASSSPIGISLAKAGWGLIFLTLAPGFSPAGEFSYIPDLSSWRPIKYAKDQASVMGWLLEKETGEASALCPRTHLHRVVKCVLLCPWYSY